MASRQEQDAPPNHPSLTDTLETRIRDLARKLAEDNATWAEQLRDVRDQEGHRYEAQVEVATWRLNTTSEAMRLLRDKARAYRQQYEQAIEELEDLEEEQRIEQQRRKMAAASTNPERLQVELQELRQWKQEAKEHRKYLANKINEMLRSYNKLHQYKKEITALLEAADQEIRRLRQELAAHVGAQGTLSDQIASIKEGLQVASEEIEKATLRRGILKMTVPPPVPTQNNENPLGPFEGWRPPIPDQTAASAPGPGPKAVPNPDPSIREPDDAGEEETTVDNTLQDYRSETTQEEGDAEATDYTQDETDADAGKSPEPRPDIQEEEDTRHTTGPDGTLEDDEICRANNKILDDIKEIVENNEKRNWYIFTFDDRLVSSIHKHSDNLKTSHSCFLCNSRGGWDGLPIRDRKLRARARIFEILYDRLLAHCEWSQAEESVEMVLWFLKRCKVPSNEIQAWPENTYDLLPNKQPGAGVAVNATQRVFEYFQTLLSPNSTRLERADLLKHIFLICHSAHALGKKLYNARIFGLRRVPPRKAIQIPKNTFWIGNNILEDQEELGGEARAGFRQHQLRFDTKTEIAYGLSAALLKHERYIEDPGYAPRITVLEKAQVVIQRRSGSFGWREMPLVFRVVCCIALVFLYFQYLMWLPGLWSLSEMPGP